MSPIRSRSAAPFARAGAGAVIKLVATPAAAPAAALVGVHKCLKRYDRSRVDGCYLDFETVRQISSRIAAMNYEERRSHPCIGGDRADLVVAGCAILEAVCRMWPVGRLRVADRGLREGLLYTMMGLQPVAAEQAACRQSPGQWD